MGLHEIAHPAITRVAFGMRRAGSSGIAVTVHPDHVTLQSGDSTATLPAATPVNAGVMSAADKSRLDDMGAAVQFSSREELLSMTVPGSIEALRTAGYSESGDGGGALYVRVAAEPAHAGKLNTADGSWWELVCEQDAVRPRQVGAACDGLADDRQALLDADALGQGIELRPGRYRVAADLTFSGPCSIRKGARLVLDSGVNVHFAAGYDADDWSWCFDASAEGSSVTGDRAPKGYVTPQHWGADPTDMAVDDRPAIEAATEYAILDPIRQEYASSFPVKFPFPGDGNYYLTKERPIYIARTTHWFGDTAGFGRVTPAVEIRAADGLDAVALAFFPGGLSAPAEYKPENPPDHATVPGIGKLYGAIRSRFTDLGFLPESGAAVRQGFVHNVTAYFTRCAAIGFSEAQFKACGAASGGIDKVFAHPGRNNADDAIDYSGNCPVKGNANLSRYTDCVAASGAVITANGGAHGFVAHGSVAGTIRYINCDAAGNQGAGFLDNTTVGIELIACHTAQNVWDVEHGGARYMCIKGHTSSADSEPGTGADWRDFWIANSSGTGNAAWAIGQYYHPAGGVNVMQAVAQASVVAHYTEGGIEVGVIGRNETTVLGGYGSTRAPWHGEFRGCRVIGGASSGEASALTFTGRTDPDDPATEYGGSLGALNGYTSGRIMQIGDGRDDPANRTGAMRFIWNTIRKRYEWQDRSNSSRPTHGVSGAGFTGTGYGGVTQAFPWMNGMYLADGSATGLSVNLIRTTVNSSTITDAAYGPAVPGMMWLYTQPTAGGKIGAVCTTGGTIGSDAVIKEFGPIDP